MTTEIKQAVSEARESVDAILENLFCEVRGKIDEATVSVRSTLDDVAASADELAHELAEANNSALDHLSGLGDLSGLGVGHLGDVGQCIEVVKDGMDDMRAAMERAGLDVHGETVEEVARTLEDLLKGLLRVVQVHRAGTSEDSIVERVQILGARSKRLEAVEQALALGRPAEVQTNQDPEDEIAYWAGILAELDRGLDEASVNKVHDDGTPATLLERFETMKSKVHDDEVAEPARVKALAPTQWIPEGEALAFVQAHTAGHVVDIIDGIEPQPEPEPDWSMISQDQDTIRRYRRHLIWQSIGSGPRWPDDLCERVEGVVARLGVASGIVSNKQALLRVNPDAYIDGEELATMLNATIPGLVSVEGDRYIVNVDQAEDFGWTQGMVDYWLWLAAWTATSRGRQQIIAPIATAPKKA